MRSLLAGLTELVSPSRCAGCDAPGGPLCPACREALPRIEPSAACPRCGAPYGFLACTECWDREWAFESAVSLGELESPLARAVVLHKDAGERRLSAEFAELLVSAVREAWPGWPPPDAVAYVPATRAARTRRGFDHAARIAEELSVRLGAPVTHSLTRRDSLDQRQLSRAARALNAAESVVATRPVAGRIILVDDVMTTGATLDAASSALLAAGACSVRCVVVARAW